MSERRVKLVGRPVYGRAMPLERPRRAGTRRPTLTFWQRRLLLLAGLAAAGLWGLASWFAVTTVTVRAANRGAEIKVETEKLLDDSMWQRNLLTLDSEVLASKLQQADPAIRSATIRRQWWHGMVVTVVLKQPSLGWSSGNQRYLLDRDGTAIGVLAAASGLPVVGDGSNLPVQVGAQVTTPRFVAFVTGLVPALAAQGITVTSLDVKDTTLDLSVGTNKGYRLTFDTSRAVADELADLKAVLASQHRTPAEYIDLRVAGKAYYK